MQDEGLRQRQWQAYQAASQRAAAGQRAIEEGLDAIQASAPPPFLLCCAAELWPKSGSMAMLRPAQTLEAPAPHFAAQL